jgi:hypothetical protein
MPHPKDNELIPKGTVCFWKKRKVEVVIKKHSFQMNEKGFLNYIVNEIGPGARTGDFAAYHDDLEPRDIL